ncbi:hypothetical protein [Lactiplantibacillus plantarum]|uniref:hypothetical protein n=1 Tax=Lactiplantibacillus plantarum TaxID=1590 RepID=UPI0028FC2963|nr:hypothetical protein [Lactiplantibacillus plantarum]WNW16712.1 hypothetical protein RUO99_04870 [Lactiplantibacillus plantarum]WNW19686.1 hypothetical protein RUP00_04865 [Lactiplantibacillus plantarum]
MIEIEKQEACQYCHYPFLDLSGKTDYEIDLEDKAYCGTDDKGILEFGASFDSGCLSKDETVNINYCPMCGRKLSEEDK